MSDNTTGNMPDLPVNQQLVEQRRVIKFWVDHCANLERINQELKDEISEMRLIIANHDEKKVV